MDFSGLRDWLDKLGIGDRKTVYTSSDKTAFLVNRPSTVGRSVKRQADPSKNFVIEVEEPGRARFAPNHTRIFLHLDAFRREYPGTRDDFLRALDRVFRGGDPTQEAPRFTGLVVQPYGRTVDYILYLHQLFIAEQELVYPGPSKFSPKSLYYQGWVRCVMAGGDEIDKILWASLRGDPPLAFTRQDNRLRKDHVDNPRDLWYLSEGPS